MRLEINFSVPKERFDELHRTMAHIEEEKIPDQVEEKKEENKTKKKKD